MKGRPFFRLFAPCLLACVHSDASVDCGEPWPFRLLYAMLHLAMEGMAWGVEMELVGRQTRGGGNICEQRGTAGDGPVYGAQFRLVNAGAHLHSYV